MLTLKSVLNNDKVIFLVKGIYLVASLLTLITLTRTKLGLPLMVKLAREINGGVSFPFEGFVTTTPKSSVEF